MTKVSRTSLIALCAALAACTDGGPRAATAPFAAPALSEAPAHLRGSATVDGLFDVELGTEAASAQLGASAQRGASAQGAASGARAATGGRASGHVELTLGTGFFTNIATEQYSFHALSTERVTPFAAKGKYDMTLTTATGVVQEFHGEVICLGITGNKARIAGQLTSVVVNGIPRLINPNASHNIWTVSDNGEGRAAADSASPMIFFPAAVAPLHCATDFIPPQFANEGSNIQVKP